MKTTLLPALIDQLFLASLSRPDPRPRATVIDLGLGLLCGQPPKTVTRAIDWLGQSQEDWSPDYRLFSQTPGEGADFLAPIFRQAVGRVGPAPQCVYVGQDDTLVRKTGKKIPGVAYARDPLSPPFQVNLVRGQRLVPTSVLVQPRGTEHPGRAIPVQFTPAPVPKIPRQATPEELAAVKTMRKKRRLSLVALAQLPFCREQLDQTSPGTPIGLTSVVDGGYAHATFLSGLPAHTEAVARFRQDARWRAYLPPDQRRGARKYGPHRPTPLAYLQDPNQPGEAVSLFIAGPMRTLNFKEIAPLCGPRCAKDRPLRLILIKAAGYRLRQGSKLLYREPAFLITTDLTTPAAVLIAAYLARWEVEVNFRDEKSLLGVGQAQVRHLLSVERAPLFLVACYAMLLLCCIQVGGGQRGEDFEPLPAWRNQKPLRPSTRDLIRRLQKEAADYPTQREKLNPYVENRREVRN
jgi:hypothetical protein